MLQRKTRIIAQTASALLACYVGMIHLGEVGPFHSHVRIKTAGFQGFFSAGGMREGLNVTEIKKKKERKAQTFFCETSRVGIKVSQVGFEA